MLYFITGNKNKFEEVKALIPEVLQLSVSVVEIQDTDPYTVIKAKLAEAGAYADAAFIVEDTSLSMDALGGLPGPFIKWFVQKLGIDGLANIASKLGNNKAVAKTIIGYARSGDEARFFEGSVRGTIVPSRGESEFGWDPIFLPDGQRKTFGEMDIEEKNKISHRRKAINELKRFLDTKK